MKNYRLYVATGLIALMALSPLLTMADTLRYQYVISLDTSTVGNSGSGNGSNEDSDNPENPEGSEGNDDQYLTYTSEWISEDGGECQNYVPAADTVPEGVWFYQQGEDCSATETRFTYTYKLDDDGQTPIVIGEPTEETRTVAKTGLTRGETGTKKEFSLYIDTIKVVSPTEVYLTWYSNGGVSYKLKSSNAQSGIPTSYVDYGSEQSIQIHPQPGTYTFTVQGTNEAGETAEASAQIEVVDFEIKNFVAQESTVTVGGDIHLSWDAPAGATLTLAGYGDVTGMSSITVQAPSWAGSNYSRLTAEKEVNGYTISTTAETAPYQVVTAP